MTNAPVPVTVARNGGLAIVTIDSPPLNLFDTAMRDALVATVGELERTSPRGVLFRHHRRPGAGAGGHRSHCRRRGRTRPGPAGRGPGHRGGASRPACETPSATGRAGLGVPGLLLPSAVARFIDRATRACLGRMAGRAVPAWRDRPTARLYPQPVPATLTTHLVPLHTPGQFRKLDAVAVLMAQLLPAPQLPGRGAELPDALLCLHAGRVALSARPEQPTGSRAYWAK
jgi:hypothetical protein